MRLTIPAILSLGLCGCGDGASHHPDATPDTSPDGPSTVTLTVTSFRAGGPVNTQFLAVEDGDGPWAVVTGVAGVYTASLHGDRYGVMTACSNAMGGTVFIHHGAVSDGLSLYIDDCDDPLPASATISGSVTGAAAANPVRVLDGWFDAEDVPAGTTAYTLSSLVGPQKLIAEELVAARPIRLAMVDANVVDGATINFDLAAGFAPVTRTLAASAPIGAASVAYRDSHSFARIDRITAPFTTYRGIPAAQLGDGLDRLLVAPATNSTSTSTSQVVLRYFKEPVDETITFPPVLQLAQPPVARATPYPEVQFTVPIDDETTLYDVSFSNTNAATTFGCNWSVEMTKAWVAKAFPGATSFPYVPPDVHGLAGWRTDFQLVAGRPISWGVDRTKAINMDAIISLPPPQFPFHDGSEEQTTSASGQLAAP